MMKKLSVKAILSSLLILVFLTLAFTGALLYFGRTGMVLGFSRHLLREVHFWVAVSMCVLIPVHLLLNLRIYWTELQALLRKKRRGDS
jgi:thiosulfate reductase cytochrome b subunit